jgi:tetrahydromethanopterin S-methyltransferase subunit G
MAKLPETVVQMMEIEARQDEVLRQLDELERRIDQVLAEYVPTTLRLAELQARQSAAASQRPLKKAA